MRQVFWLLADYHEWEFPPEVAALIHYCYCVDKFLNAVRSHTNLGDSQQVSC